MPNPYFGAFNMNAMRSMNHVYGNQFSVNFANVGSSSSVVLPEVKRHNFKDEVLSKPSKSKENNGSKPRGGF